MDSNKRILDGYNKRFLKERQAKALRTNEGSKTVGNIVVEEKKRIRTTPFEKICTPNGTTNTLRHGHNEGVPIIVSGPTTTTGMPAKSIGRTLATGNSLKPTYVQSTLTKSLTTSFSLLAFLARVSALLDRGWALKTLVDSYSGRYSELRELSDLRYSSLKMLQDSYRQKLKSAQESIRQVTAFTEPVGSHQNKTEIPPLNPRSLQEPTKKKLKLMKERENLRLIIKESKTNPKEAGKKLRHLLARVTASSESSNPFSTWGICGLNGRLLTARNMAYRRIGTVCSLSDILETEVDEKYFLSQEATKNLLNHQKKYKSRTPPTEPQTDGANG